MLAHVGAGLCNRDWAMPEEINRVVTDRVSDFLLAPSPDAVSNLRREGYREDQIHLVGNVMVDTLLANLAARWPGTRWPAWACEPASTSWSPCTARERRTILKARLRPR